MKKLLLFFLFFPLFLKGNEEHLYLNNIQQLTFPSMGFTKAGEAYFSPDEKFIIFQAVPLGEENYQIYVMNLEEKKPLKVSPGKTACTCGYFSPNGKKILFASSHSAPYEEKKESIPGQKYKWDLTPYMNLYEANYDGSELHPLTTGPAYHAEGSYSPDGKEVLYASNQDGNMNLYILNLETGETFQVTNTHFSYNGGPFFSPDGTKIIFRTDREKPDYLQIHLINKDGANEKLLNKNTFVNWAPYWHPNGKVIAFTTSIHGHHQYEIYLLNIETGATSRLTNHKGFDGLPVFNGKGDKLLWTSQRGGNNACQIFISDFKMPKKLIE